ncbi:MAG: calcium-binding protein, partial [Hormoscilla sp. GUM202]|nr:calcium-binding protein [Hormoscilla sp. GUM202]
ERYDSSGTRGTEFHGGAKDNDFGSYLEKRNDLLYGNGGNDRLESGPGEDTLYGGAGNDVLGGGDGKDLLYGENENDTLYGGAGDDTLIGGRGDDYLHGGDGSDMLYGNSGADIFNLQVAHHENGDPRFDDHKTIGDFENGADKILLSGDLSFSMLEFVSMGSSTAIQFHSEAFLVHPRTREDVFVGGELLAILPGTTPDQFDSTDFVRVVG